MLSSLFNKESIPKNVRDKQLAFQLVRHEAWREYLKPILESIANSTERVEIRSEEDVYRVAREHARIQLARDLIARTERLAKDLKV